MVVNAKFLASPPFFVGEASEFHRPLTNDKLKARTHNKGVSPAGFRKIYKAKILGQNSLEIIDSKDFGIFYFSRRKRRGLTSTVTVFR
jgi:hypothetical protein